MKTRRLAIIVLLAVLPSLGVFAQDTSNGKGETEMENIGKKAASGFEKIEDATVNGYKAIENGVVDGYMKVQNGAVNGYTKFQNGVVDCWGKFEDWMVEKLFGREGETVEQTRERLRKK